MSVLLQYPILLLLAVGRRVGVFVAVSGQPFGSLVLTR